MTERMLSTVEAATLLRLNPKTLGKWRCKGIGPPVMHFGRVVRYPESLLLRWCRDHTKIDLGRVRRDGLTYHARA